MANLVVLACTLALIAAISWGVGAVLPPRQPPGAVPRRPGGQRRRDARAWPADRHEAPATRLLAAADRRRRWSLSGCAGTDGDRVPPPAARHGARGRRRRPRRAPRSPRPRARPAGQRIEVTVAGGQVSGDTGRVPVAVGEHGDARRHQRRRRRGAPARLRPDRRARPPGSRPSSPSTPPVPGVFEVELHEAGTVLLTLQVGMNLLAHGVGSRTDLPIPLGLALYGAGAAILISFAVLLLFWRTPRLGGPSSGRPLPAGRAAAARQRRPCGAACRRSPSPSPRWSSPSALAGPDETDRNLAPWALYVTFWVGLVPASLLLGPVWRVVNPLRLLHRGLRVVAPVGARRAAARRRWGCGRPSARCSSSSGWSSCSPPGPSRRRSPSSCSATRRCTSALALWFGEELVRPRRRLRGLLDADRPALPLGTARRRPAGAAQPAGERVGGAGRARARRRRGRAARVDGVRRPVPHGVLADRPGRGERHALGHRSACWR